MASSQVDRIDVKLWIVRFMMWTDVYTACIFYLLTLTLFIHKNQYMSCCPGERCPSGTLSSAVVETKTLLTSMSLLLAQKQPGQMCHYLCFTVRPAADLTLMYEHLTVGKLSLLILPTPNSSWGDVIINIIGKSRRSGKRRRGRRIGNDVNAADFTTIC